MPNISRFSLDKISNFVNSQIPRYILDQSPNFGEFVKSYYEFNENRLINLVITANSEITPIGSGEFVATINSLMCDDGITFLGDGTDTDPILELDTYVNDYKIVYSSDFIGETFGSYDLRTEDNAYFKNVTANYKSGSPSDLDLTTDIFVISDSIINNSNYYILTLSDVNGSFTVNDTIREDISGTEATVISYDGSNTLKVSIPSTGFFHTNGVIKNILNSSVYATIQSITSRDIPKLHSIADHKNPIYTLSNLFNFGDIDYSFTNNDVDFNSCFINEILKDWPKEFYSSIENGYKGLISQHISDVYLSKGTSNSIKAVSKILWNSNVSIDIPGEKINTLNTGLWNSTIKKLLVKIDANGSILNSANTIIYKESDSSNYFLVSSITEELIGETDEAAYVTPYETAVIFDSTTKKGLSACKVDTNKIAVCYNGGSAGESNFIVGTVRDSIIDFNTSPRGLSNDFCDSEYNVMCYDSNSDSVVIAYNNKVTVGYANGASYDFYPEQDILSDGILIHKIAHVPSVNKLAIIYYDSSSDVYLRVGALEDGIFSWTTSPVTLTDAINSDIPESFSVLGVDNTVICAYALSSGVVRSEVFAVSDTALTLREGIQFTPATDIILNVSSTYDSYNEKIVYLIGYAETLKTAYASANNISDISETVELSNVSNYEVNDDFQFQNIGCVHDSAVNNIIYSWEVRTGTNDTQQYIKTGNIVNDIFVSNSFPISISISENSSEYILSPDVISNKTVVFSRPYQNNIIRYAIAKAGKTGNAIIDIENPYSSMIGNINAGDTIYGISLDDESFTTVVYSIEHLSNYITDRNLLNGGVERELPINYSEWNDIAAAAVIDYSVGSVVQDSYYYQPYSYDINGSNFFSRENYQFAKAACGYDHNIAIKLDGNIILWGNNDHGQLGINSRITQTTPIEITSGANHEWIDIAAGQYSSYAIKAATGSDHGTLWSWGNNEYGQLGYSTTELVYGDIYANISTLTQVGNDTGWKNGFTRGYMAVDNEGKLWAWGYNGYGQVGNGTTEDCFTPFPVKMPSQLTSGENWAQGAYGATHSAAITSNSVLWTWGNNDYGQLGTGNTDAQLLPTKVPGDNWKHVVVGYNYTIALTNDGELYAWGSNEYGQLGQGNTIDLLVPTQIGTDSGWVAVDTQYYHCVALDSNRQIWTWGKNNYGALGSGGNGDQWLPVQLVDGPQTYSWNEISAGVDHTLAIKDDGTLWGWGNNKYGQLGLDESIETQSPDFTVLELQPTEIIIDDENVPVQPVWSSDWLDDSITTLIGHDSNFYVTIDSTGALWSWGSNDYGQLGDGTKVTRYNPVQVGSDTDWSQIAIGSNYTIALKTDGTLWGWGRNNHGQLGIGNNTDQSSPVRIGLATTWAQVTCGEFHTLAIKANGTLWAWGNNNYNQLGTGDNVSYNQPTQIGSSTTWAQVRCSAYHTMAIRNNGTLWGWGRNEYDQLGLGSIGTDTQKTPIQIGTDTDWKQIVCGPHHTIGLKTSGTLHGWGSNEYGQLSVGTDTDWKQVTTNFYSTLAIKTDGTLWAWGWNSYGELGDNTQTSRTSPVQIGNKSDWRQVHNSFTSSYATNSSGEIYSWGQNDAGQLGYITGYVYNNNTNSPLQIGTASNWRHVSAGHLYSTAIKSDETLWTWGYNRYGQLGHGNTIDYNIPTKVKSSFSWDSVSCFQNTLHAVRNDGVLFGVGYNETGNIGTTTAKGYVYDTVDRLYPSQIGSDFDWKSVAANTNGSFALGIKTDGTLWSWGYGGFGQLGTANTENQFSPVQVGSSNNWSKVSLGKNFVMAITNDGTLWAWGQNGDGQLGNGTTGIHELLPVQISTQNEWKDVSCGENSTIGLKTNSTLWAWGNNDYGQLGIGNTHSKTIPTLISSKPWSFVSSGDNYNFAINNDNNLYAWGEVSRSIGINTLEQYLSKPTLVNDVAWDKCYGGRKTSIGISSNVLYVWGEDYLGDSQIMSSYDPIEIITIPNDAVLIEDYRAVIQTIAHPAGMKMFINGE